MEIQKSMSSRSKDATGKCRGMDMQKLRSHRSKSRTQLSSSKNLLQKSSVRSNESFGLHGSLDIRRKALLANGGPIDNSKDAFVEPISNFDLDNTIFTTVDNALTRKLLSKQLATRLVWSEESIARIEKAYSKVPKQVDDKTNHNLLRFMAKDCNFKMEHADGSFMDHLVFCRDYSSAYYRGNSPWVLYLHSILGTATNFFPMKVEKLNTLKKLVGPDDFQHLQAFPTVLRLLYSFSLLSKLRENNHRLDKLKGITMHRALDNEKIKLSGDQLWTHLNFHLIHTLDFLPAVDWVNTIHSTQYGPFETFIDLHEFLSKARRLNATVTWDASSIEAPGKNATLATVMKTWVPFRPAKRAMQAKTMKDFSQKIGHSLEFELLWREE